MRGHTQSDMHPAIQPHASRIRHDTYAPTCAAHHIGGRPKPNDVYPSRFACANMRTPRHQPSPRKTQKPNPRSPQTDSTARSQQQRRSNLHLSPVARPVTMSSLTVCPQPNGQYGNLGSGTSQPDRSQCPVSCPVARPVTMSGRTTAQSTSDKAAEHPGKL